MGAERHDYHVHSAYSDGTDATAMVETATTIGLDGIGFADHVLLSHPEKLAAHGYPMSLDAVADRRETIGRISERTNIRIFEAVEIDFYAHDEDSIRRFLNANEFDYVVGSVHELGPYHPENPQPSVHHNDDAYFEDMTETDRMEYVDRYFDNVVTLIESELADIIAHPDLIERNPALRGLAGDEHFHQVAAAIEQSSSVPEINGAAVTDDWPVLPRRAFFEVLSEYDITFVRGSDAHGTASLEVRNDRIDRIVEDHGIELHAIW